jgi:hypothetical protein
MLDVRIEPGVSIVGVSLAVVMHRSRFIANNASSQIPRRARAQGLRMNEVMEIVETSVQSELMRHQVADDTKDNRFWSC